MAPHLTRITDQLAKEPQPLQQQVPLEERSSKPSQSSPSSSTSSTSASASTSSSSKPGLHVVVSHCDESLDWIWTKYLNDDPFKSLTILSKCGKPPSHTELPLSASSSSNDSSSANNVFVIELPNVGRCDHSYAYWIQQLFTTDPSQRNPVFQNSSLFRDMRPDDHVIFMKGNDNTYRGEWEETFSLSHMRNATTVTGFSCATKIHKHQEFKRGEEPTNVVEGWTLGSFQLPTYTRKSQEQEDNTEFFAKHRPLANWLTSLGESIEFPLTTSYFPVCYGGQFMTTVRRILYTPVRDWKPIVDSLSRGDNIEEGHFMERMWAGWLSPPIPQAEQDAMKERFKRVFVDQAYTGLVVLQKENKKQSKQPNQHKEKAQSPRKKN